MNLTPEKRNLIAKWLIKIAAVCILLYLCLQNIAAISAALSRFLDLIMPLILGSAIAVIRRCAFWRRIFGRRAIIRSYRG